MRAEPRSPEHVLSIETGARSGLHVHARAACSRAGAARGALVLAVLLVLLLGVGAAIFAGLLVFPAVTDSVQAEQPLARSEATDPGTRATAQGETPDRRPFAARGQLQGALTVPPASTIPERWELCVRPLLAAPGARTHTVEFRSGESEFDVPDLPFGAYEVLAVAEGMNGFAQRIDLTAESPWVYVVTALSPAGELSGRIQHPDGSGIAGLPLRLLDVGSGLVHETVTDLGGVYRFARIPDGEYRLLYGEPENPLLEPRSLSFRAPGMHLPPDIVEGVGAVSFEVVDRRGAPVEAVALTGSGSLGGTIDEVSDAAGRAEVPALPSGEYRVWSAHPDFGRSLEVFELRSGGHPVVRFVLE